MFIINGYNTTLCTFICLGAAVLYQRIISSPWHSKGVFPNVRDNPFRFKATIYLHLGVFTTSHTFLQVFKHSFHKIFFQGQRLAHTQFSHFIIQNVSVFTFCKTSETLCCQIFQDLSRILFLNIPRHASHSVSALCRAPIFYFSRILVPTLSETCLTLFFTLPTLFTPLAMVLAKRLN